MTATTKKSSELTLKDRLSRLSYTRACKLLGANGKNLIMQGSKYDSIDIDEHVFIGNDLFRLNLPGAIVTITLMAEKRNRLHFCCTACENFCEHIGAAVSLILEEKTALGLAKVPPPRIPVESMSEEELVQKVLAERRERARTEKMRLTSLNPKEIWTDYTLTSAVSGKTYRVALRGWEPGESYCSCPDFRKNTLGTCKHIMYALDKVKKRFPAEVRNQPYERKHISLHLVYGKDTELRLLLPGNLPPNIARLVKPFRDHPVNDILGLLACINKLERADHPVTIYPDAEEFIQQRLYQNRISNLVAEIRKNPATHPLRKALLKTELLPYQLDGIAFSVGAGRAILADDMGLGKTIQGIGVSEMLAREAGISKVLVICPTSLKSQWRNEIHRFSDRDCQLILGPAAKRSLQYNNECFFTICNYEQVLRDIQHIEALRWDLIILDEGQRIKNWEAQTSRTIKSLRSRFALVLSGTPMENRLDELFSVAEFIDERRLGPAFRFYNRHRVVDEKGKVMGYKNLDQLRETLKPMLLRRTRGMVMKELPPRTDEILRIPATGEQIELNDAQMRIVLSIINKPYISEMDLLRLQKALLMARMGADSTFLVYKDPPGYSSKLVEMDNLIDRLTQEENRKIVLFSEWTTMLGLIEERILQPRSIQYVRLDGSIPQKKRQGLVHEFQSNPDCQLFITTNAGSTGLNLQAANTVINVDLPWNPAVLEQRIARAHRMGQKRPVQVFILVTEGTIEEKMLGTLSAKQNLALAALDVDSDVNVVDMASGMEELRNRLEILIGAKPEAELDESVRNRQEAQAARLVEGARMAEAGGELLSAAFSFLGSMLPADEKSDKQTEQMASLIRKQFEKSVSKDEQGRPQLTVTLPDASTLDALAASLARIMGRAGK